MFCSQICHREQQHKHLLGSPLFSNFRTVRIIHHKVSLLLHLVQRNIYSFCEFSSSSEFILPGVSPPVPLGFFPFVFTFKTIGLLGGVED